MKDFVGRFGPWALVTGASSGIGEAFAGVPSWSTYAASKAQELVFAEGLAEELRKDGISVLADCPGPTQTEFWLSGAKPFFLLQPNAVVDVALKKLGRKIAVVAGWTNSIIAFSTRLLPRSWNAKIFGRVIGKMIEVVKTPAAALEPERNHFPETLITKEYSHDTD